MTDPSGCCNQHSPSIPLFCSQGAASSETLPETGLGQVSLAAGSGSAVHSCARLAASPALLLMPLHSPVRTSNGMHFCRLWMPREHPGSPCLL